MTRTLSRLRESTDRTGGITRAGGRTETTLERRTRFDRSKNGFDGAPVLPAVSDFWAWAGPCPKSLESLYTIFVQCSKFRDDNFSSN